VGCRGGLPASAPGGRMSKFSRRRMLLALSVAPVSMLASGYSFFSTPDLSVAEAMRRLVSSRMD